MGAIAESTYIKEGITKEWLDKNKFKPNKFYSNEEDGNVYTYRFHAIYYKDTATLDCEFNYYELSNEIRVDVWRNFGERNKYYPFYHVDCGNYDPILNDIEKSIRKEMKKLGIKKI